MAKKAQKGGGSALDLGMAAFAATAAGFVIYAMPNAQFDRAVELSGLPMLLPAAQPPLGMTARAAAIAAMAVGTWLLVWLVLRALTKKAPAPKRRVRPKQIEVPTPRLRRADAHPDAPARAPIFAGLELGTPLDQEPEPAPVAAFEEEPEPAEIALEPEWFDREPNLAEAQPEWAEAEPEDFSIQAEADFPAEEDPRDFMEVDVFSDELELTLDYAESPEVFDSEPAGQSAAEHEHASISHLMQRLELGLLRRERSSWDLATGEAQRRSEPTPELDQRLRSAIDDLQRLSARGR